jgi:hypothetical protein
MPRHRNTEPMSKQRGKHGTTEDIEAIAERAERGEDVSAYFTNQYVAKQRVNIDFPLGLLQRIDAECQRVGVTRQAWIKMVCDERLRQTPKSASDVPVQAQKKRGISKR